MTLRVALALSGMKDKEVAAKIGLHPTVLSSIKLGRQNPSPAQQAALADALGWSVSDLFPCEPERRRA